MTISNNPNYFKLLDGKVVLNNTNNNKINPTNTENVVETTPSTNVVEAKPTMSSTKALSILNGETGYGSEVEESGRLTREEALELGYTIIDNIYDFQCLNSEGKYILMCDLDFKNITRKSIKSIGASRQFHGELNGNGYTIKNLNIEGQGIFTSSSHATFKNIVFDNVNVNNNGEAYAGILCGSAGYSIFENIVIKNSTLNGGGAEYAGALTGNSYDSVCKDIRIENTVVSDAEIAGLLAGYGSDTIVENLYLQGTVDCQNATENSMAGGVFGYLDKSSYCGAGEPPSMYYFYEENHDIYKNVNVTLKNASRTHTYFGSETKFIDEVGYSLEESFEISNKIAEEKGFKPTEYPHIYTFVDEEKGSYSIITFNWGQNKYSEPESYGISTYLGNEEDMLNHLSRYTSDTDIAIQKAVNKGFERIAWVDQEMPLFIKDNKFYIYNRNNDKFEEVDHQDYNIGSIILKSKNNKTTTPLNVETSLTPMVSTKSNVSVPETGDDTARLTIESSYLEANGLAEQTGYKPSLTFGIYEKNGIEYEYDIYDMKFLPRSKSISTKTRSKKHKTLFEIYISAKILATKLGYESTELFDVYVDSEGQKWEYNIKKEIFEKLI